MALTLNRAPVFVLGAPGSGASLVSWSLAQHPSFSHALDTSWLVEWAALAHTIHRRSLTEPERSALAARQVGEADLHRALGSALNDFLAGTRVRWVDYTMGHSRYVPALVRLFPEAKFVHVVRDAVSVVRTLTTDSDRDWAGGPEAACESWLTIHRAAFEAEQAYGTPRVFRIRHADLVSQPSRSLARCLGFLEEPFDSVCLRPFCGIEALPEPDADAGFGPWNEVPEPMREEASRLSRLLIETPSSPRGPDPGRVSGLEERCFRALAAGQPGLEARSLVERAREAVRRRLPPDARVIVVSKGDPELLDLAGRQACHFPQNNAGDYAGYYPATSEEAILQLEALMEQGYGYLLVPEPYYWWLRAYEGFADRLRRDARLVFYQDDGCMIFRLDRQPQRGAARVIVVAADEPEGDGR